MRARTACIIIRRLFRGVRSLLSLFRGDFVKSLIGEVAERSKALDWNSSNIFTGVRGFESHPLRQTIAKPAGCSPAKTTLFAGECDGAGRLAAETAAGRFSQLTWWLASVSPRRPVVNPVRAGRQQRQRRCRVPEAKLVRAASIRSGQ
jgi:hypothetical protein